MPRNVLKSVFVIASLLCSSAPLRAQESQENSVSFCENLRRRFCDCAFYPHGVNDMEKRGINDALNQVGFFNRSEFGRLFSQWISSNSHPFTADCSIQSLARREAQDWPLYKNFVSDVLRLDGSFEFRVGKLVDTLKEWKAKDPTEHQAFVAFLGLDPSAAIDQTTLSHKLKVFMASTENGQNAIEESTKDIETVIERFIQGKDVSVFNPLDFYIGEKTKNTFWGMPFDRVVSNVVSNISKDNFDSFKEVCRQAIEQMKVDHEDKSLQNPVAKAEDVSWLIRGVSMVPVKSLPHAFEVAKQLTPPSASGYARGLIWAGLSDIKPDDSNVVTYLEPYQSLSTNPNLQESVVRVFVRTPEESRNQLREAVNSLSELALEQRNTLKKSYHWGDQEEKLIFQAWAIQSLGFAALSSGPKLGLETMTELLSYLSGKLQSANVREFLYNDMYKQSQAWYAARYPQPTITAVTTCC